MQWQARHWKTAGEVASLPHLGQRSALTIPIIHPKRFNPNNPLLQHSSPSPYDVLRSISLRDFSRSPSRSPTSKPTARAPSRVAMQIMTKSSTSFGGGSSPGRRVLGARAECLARAGDDARARLRRDLRRPRLLVGAAVDLGRAAD